MSTLESARKRRVDEGENGVAIAHIHHFDLAFAAGIEAELACLIQFTAEQIASENRCAALGKCQANGAPRSRAPRQ